MSYDYENNPPIGIDLGTSNSVIAHYANTARIRGALVYQLNSNGGKSDMTLMPSCVFLEVDDEEVDELLVGVAAENKWRNDPNSFAKAIKRKIGDLGETIVLGDKAFSPMVLSKELIKTLMNDPTLQNPEWKPAGFVISVPYYFKQNQNNNTLKALELAVEEYFIDYPVQERPKVLGLIPEPVACAISYIEDISGSGTINDRRVVVFDLGGGTLDVTLFKLSIGGEKLNFEILSTGGNAAFGGEDFDQLIVDYVLESEEVNLVEQSDKKVRFFEHEIANSARMAKEKLSFTMEADLIVSNLPSGGNIDIMLSRSDFESLLSGRNKAGRNFGRELSEILDKTLTLAKVKADEVDLILTVGGSSQIPYFSKILEAKFKKAEYQTSSEKVKHSVAKGAALYAGHLLDIHHGHNHKSLAKGISYETAEIKFRTAHRLGIEKQQGRMSTLIPANSLVPARKSKQFIPTAYLDFNKTLVNLNSISVYQGSDQFLKENTKIGDISIPSIHTHGRSLQEVKIKVDFEASETTLVTKVFIPKATEEMNDINLERKIELTHE